MKTYLQLTAFQQERAQAAALNALLTDITQGAGTCEGDLSERIHQAQAKADTMRTPWFAAEYILDTCRSDLEQIADSSAQSAIYLEVGEYAVEGIA